MGSIPADNARLPKYTFCLGTICILASNFIPLILCTYSIIHCVFLWNILSIYVISCFSYPLCFWTGRASIDCDSIPLLTVLRTLMKNCKVQRSLEKMWNNCTQGTKTLKVKETFTRLVMLACWTLNRKMKVNGFLSFNFS